MNIHRILNQQKSENVRQFIMNMHMLFHKKIGDKKKPIIVIHGGFGHNNTGDDALLVTTKQFVIDMYPDAKIIALGHHPQLTIEHYKKELKNVIPVKFKSLKTAFYLLACDGYIIAGGGLSHVYYHKSKIRYLFEPRGKFCHLVTIIENLRRTPMVIFFCGYHAIPDFFQKYIMKLALKHIPLLGVRDSYSGDFLSEIGIDNYIVGFDPVLLYGNFKSYNLNDVFSQYGYKINEMDYVLLNVRQVVDTELSEKVIREIADYICDFAKEHSKFYFVLQPYSVRTNFATENDLVCNEKIAKCVYDKSPDVKLILLKTYQNIYDAKIWASHAKLLLLARHHALILTYEFDIPTIALSYDIKVRGFAETGGYHSIIDYEGITADNLKKETKKLEGIYGRFK